MIICAPEEMLAVGKKLAAELSGDELITIHGSLGAGKTLLCKGLIEALGFAGEVSSPTFNIVNHYFPPDLRLAVAHADLYRLVHSAELEEIGLFAEPAVKLVEWPEKGGAAMQRPDVRIDIVILDAARRDVKISRDNTA